MTHCSCLIANSALDKPPDQQGFFNQGLTDKSGIGGFNRCIQCRQVRLKGDLVSTAGSSGHLN